MPMKKKTHRYSCKIGLFLIELFWRLPRWHLSIFGTFRVTFIEKRTLFMMYGNGWNLGSVIGSKKNPLKKYGTWCQSIFFGQTSLIQRRSLGMFNQNKKSPLKTLKPGVVSNWLFVKTSIHPKERYFGHAIPTKKSPL